MTWGVCTVVYNGYGRFIPQLMESILAQTRRPEEVVIVAAGDNHGLEREPEGAKVIYTDMAADGDLRALAVTHTETDWVCYFSADDVFQSHAFETYERFVEVYTDTDMIATAWVQEEEGKKPRVRQCALPEEIARKGAGFFCGHSPFKKSAWERNRWPAGCYFPTMPLLANMVEDGCKIRRLREPTWTYLKRKSGRDFVLSPKRKAEAKALEREAFARIKRHYGN